MKKYCIFLLVMLAFLSCGKEQQLQQKPSGTYKQLNLVDYNNLMASNKGKVVIVNFFATWCPPCRKEVPELIKLAKAYDGKNLQIIGISVDENGEEAVIPFAQQVGFNYPVYLTTPELNKTFNIDAVPQIFLYSKDGTLITNLKGYVDTKELMPIIDKLL
jgi:thiol-disulfide isomerase/thioredoxin